MKKWNLYAVVTGTKHLGVVEAETMEEAQEKGWGHPESGISLCVQCSDECSDPEISEIVAEEV